MDRLSWFRRWYWLGFPPAAALLGYWLGSLLIPDWIVALGIVALTLSGSGVMYWSNMRWIARQKEKLAALAVAPVPLNPQVMEHLWRSAQNVGLITEADATAIIARNKAMWAQQGPSIVVSLNEHTTIRPAEGRETTIKNEEYGDNEPLVRRPLAPGELPGSDL